MIETQYGITKAIPSLPSRDLLKIPHREGDLVVGFPAFGPDAYCINLGEMSKTYSHSKKLPKISFRPATTSESISVAAYNFENMAKSQIFDLLKSQLRLYIGYVFKTSEGVFVNPPTVDEKILKSYLNNSKKINGIYLGENDFGFVPYKTFTKGEQDSDTFCEGGLARVLEHTQERLAKNLKIISSPINYPNGVDVFDFWEAVSVFSSVSLYSFGRPNRRLVVRGGGWFDEKGYAFGVLEDVKTPKNL